MTEHHLTGTLYGVGVGPGDPDLMTLKAARLIGAAPVVAYFRKAGRTGHARTIADGLIPPTAIEVPMDYPVTTEISIEDDAYAATLAPFYARMAEILAAHLRAGRDVVVLAEGDPFFYGSFMHLYTRLIGQCQIEVVPGVTGMAGAWTLSGEPITWGDDILTVLPGTLPLEALADHARRADALVIMKVGRNLDKIRQALAQAGRLHEAIYVERATMTGQHVERLAAREIKPAPYFSIVLVPGRGRRPLAQAVR